MASPKQLDIKVGPVQKAQIQRRVALARAKPRPTGWAVLAKQENTSERTLRHWHERWKIHQAFYDDPLDVIGETLDTLTAMIEETSADIATADHPSAKVGFNRVLIDLLVKRLNLLVEVGRMPRDMMGFETSGHVRQMIMRMAEVIERHDLPAEVAQDMLEIIEQASGQPAAP